MKLNLDLHCAVVVKAGEMAWTASPCEGVKRRMLERDGDEIVQRASSIVCYAPGSSFYMHPHPGGEEFLVLDGVFSDEHGNYPRGTYVRNPPGFVHSPFSEDGCIILVKLGQMSAIDMCRVIVNSRLMRISNGNGGCECLHSSSREEVVMVELSAGGTLDARDHVGGEEILVIDGTVHSAEFGVMGAWTWLRNPADASLPLASPEGALLWIKRGGISDPHSGNVFDSHNA